MKTELSVLAGGTLKLVVYKGLGGALPITPPIGTIYANSSNVYANSSNIYANGSQGN